MVEEIHILLLLPEFEIKEVLNLLGGYGKGYFQDSHKVNCITTNNVREQRENDGHTDFALEETKNGNNNAAMAVFQYEKDGEQDSLINETDKSKEKSCKPSVCSDCGKMFSGNQLKKHKHKMHSNLQRKYSCDTCNLSLI